MEGAQDEGARLLPRKAEVTRHERQVQHDPYDAWRARPEDLEQAGEPAWFDHVYLRDNPRGAHREYWQHVGGCRQFVKVVRDTATHEITGTYAPHEEPNA